MEGQQCHVVSGVECCRLLPHGALQDPPGWTFSNFDVIKAGIPQSLAQVDPPQPGGQPFVARVDGLPTGEHRAPTGCQNPQQFAVGGVRMIGELN